VRLGSGGSQTTIWDQVGKSERDARNLDRDVELSFRNFTSARNKNATGGVIGGKNGPRFNGVKSQSKGGLEKQRGRDNEKTQQQGE